MNKRKRGIDEKNKISATTDRSLEPYAHKRCS